MTRTRCLWLGERRRVARKACWGKNVDLVKEYGPFPLGAEKLLKISSGGRVRCLELSKLFLSTWNTFWGNYLRKCSWNPCKETENFPLSYKWWSLISVQFCPVLIPHTVALQLTFSNCHCAALQKGFPNKPTVPWLIEINWKRNFKLLASWTELAGVDVDCIDDRRISHHMSLKGRELFDGLKETLFLYTSFPSVLQSRRPG